MLCLKVASLHSTHRIDLPELQSIEMGWNALSFAESDETTTLVMRGASH